MKKLKLHLLSCFSLLALTGFAQNTFPTSGNVGIGTTSPNSRLEIVSNSGQTENLLKLRVSDASPDYFQILNGTGHGNRFMPTLKGNVESSAITSLLLMASTNATYDNSSSSAVMRFDTRRSSNQPITNRSLFQWTNYTQKLMTLNAQGALGIGTTNPIAKLDVRGVINSSHSDGRNTNLFISGDGNSYINYSGGNTSSRFGFQIDGSSKMSIKNNGNVGIGTTNPTKKLTVKGEILCEEVQVVVDANAPDYVFETYYDGSSKLKPSYVMPTLEEVEAYTKANNHLPEVPSAEAFKKDGLELKDMSMLLLQKIEELTLYTIEQEKRIKLLEARLNN